MTTRAYQRAMLNEAIKHNKTTKDGFNKMQDILQKKFEEHQKEITATLETISNINNQITVKQFTQFIAKIKQFNDQHRKNSENLLSCINKINIALMNPFSEKTNTHHLRFLLEIDNNSKKQFNKFSKIIQEQNSEKMDEFMEKIREENTKYKTEFIDQNKKLVASLQVSE